MKSYILTTFLIGLLLLPATVVADTLTYEEAWSGYLYELYLSYSQGALSQTGPYYIASGEAPEFPIGAWRLDILDSQDRIIYTRSLDPAGLAASDGVLFVPYRDSGTTMLFTNPSGENALTVDLTGSRACDDNGSCDSAYGENSSTCPGDCGGSAVIPGAGQYPQTAAISDQSSFGRQLGGLLLRLSYAAAGFIVLIGVARLLDRHRTP